MYTKTICLGLVASAGTALMERDSSCSASHSVIDHFLNDDPDGDTSIDLLQLGPLSDLSDHCSDNSDLFPALSTPYSLKLTQRANRGKDRLRKPSKEAIRKKRWRDTLSKERKERIKKREREQKRRRFHLLSDEGRAEHRKRDRIRKQRERNSETPVQKEDRLARERKRKAMLRAKRKGGDQVEPVSKKKNCNISHNENETEDFLVSENESTSGIVNSEVCPELEKETYSPNDMETVRIQELQTFIDEEEDNAEKESTSFSLETPVLVPWEAEVGPGIYEISDDLVSDLFHKETYLCDLS